MNATDLLLGVGCGLAVSWLGLRSRYLTWGGAAVVALAAGLGFVAGGAQWGVPTLAWALANLFWVRYRRAQKDALLARPVGGGRQNAEAMLGRLSWAMLLAAHHGLAPEQPNLLPAYVGALAASAADTWSTEVGLLSTQPPRSLISRRPVPAGTAGATSALGAVAALGGAWLMGFAGLATAWGVAWAAGHGLARTELWLPVAAMIGGIAGTLTDSLLGATAQGIYTCERCGRDVESRRCTCGGTARQVRGWAWLNNAGIDLAGAVVGAAATAALAIWLAHSVG